MHRKNSSVTVTSLPHKLELTIGSLATAVVGYLLTCICLYEHRHFKNTIKTTFSSLESPSFHFCAATSVGISNYSHKACYVRFVALIAFPLPENNKASNHEIPGKILFFGVRWGGEGGFHVKNIRNFKNHWTRRVSWSIFLWNNESLPIRNNVLQTYIYSCFSSANSVRSVIRIVSFIRSGHYVKIMKFCMELSYIHKPTYRISRF